MWTQYKKSSKRNVFSNRDDLNETKLEGDQELQSNYLDIWEVNPSYKDIDSKISIAKSLSLMIILLFLSFSTYLITHNLNISVGLSIFILFFFIIVFSDNFFCFRNLWFLFAHGLSPCYPFKNIKFWNIKEDSATILMMNRKDSLYVAIRIFKVEILPETVHPTLNQFIKALNKAKIQYTYQVTQNPIIEGSKNSNINILQTESFKTSIYFSVYSSTNGILTNFRLKNLLETITDFSNEFKSNFSANFHHTKASLLEGNDLINAIRTFFYNPSIQSVKKESNQFESKTILLHTLLKTSCISFLVIYLSFILISFNLPLIIIILINLILDISIIFIWWREILSYFSKMRLSRSIKITQINPFVDVKFFRVNRLKDIIYAYIDNQLLVASKIFNLKFANQPTLTYFDKFIRGIENHKISFKYNLQVAPVSADPFPSECSKSFNEKTKESLEGILYRPLDKPNVKYVKYPKIEFEKWLDMRSGIWKTMLTISTSCYLFTNILKSEDIIELRQKLSRNAKTLKGTFEDNFLSFKLVELKNHQLISGFLSECLKNHLFRLNGSHLNYVYFQGKSLMELAKIANEFKKGIDTRIAAEFNTPLQLENFITIGETINTEFLEEEIPLGFTSNQVKQLLITNGIPSYREHATMKIVSELVKLNIPCVIFDYTGKWSKLIQLFGNTSYQHNFLHFKLGSSFSIDIKSSGIKYDQNNIEYLNLFYDVFAMAFKEQKRNVDILKETISKSDELNLSSITLDLQVKQKLNKPFYSNSLLLLFKDFTDQTQIFSNTALEYEDNINPIDFLRNDKTVIIDLSILKDLDKKTFITFIILSKFIHLIENSEDYHKKIIIIPHVDLFFDSYYIDANYGPTNYGKIDKFIDPLLQRGFGIIFSANQIRYLHPHVFNYFRNIITFRANDKRDLAVLKNQMNLQELHGTGYYSTKRNNTYQIDYLMNMQNDEIIVKRSDIYQPFPGKISYGNLIKMPNLSHDQVIEYMEKQGYKLIISEKKLLSRARKTIFEKDFGIYANYVDEIIHFLKTISSIDKVGNFYKGKLKSELLKYIAPKAAKTVQDKVQIKEIRDELFGLLVKHGYLVENHPKRAGGSEAIRTSYAVGSQYQKALQDYFETKENVSSDITMEVVNENSAADSNLLNIFQEKTTKEVIDREKYQEILSAQVGETMWNLYQIYSSNNKENLVNSLKIGKDIIPEFLSNLYELYLQNSNKGIPELENINLFLNYLIKNELLPFSRQDLQNYMKKIKGIVSDNGDIERRAVELYDLLAEFQGKLNNFQIN